MDIWKHYLVIGCLDLRLLNLSDKDFRKTLQIKLEVYTLTLDNYVNAKHHAAVSPTCICCYNQGTKHPNLVAFTPRGKLLSYNQSQPDTITLWPQVDSIWSASGTRCEGCLKMEHVNDVNRYASKKFVY